MKKSVIILLVFSLIFQPVITYSATSPWSPSDSYTLSLSEKLTNTNFDTNTDNWSVAQSYTLNDQFTTAKTSAELTPDTTSAEPTGGLRTVTDTNSKLSITGGQLSMATGGVGAGDPSLWYSTITRGLGKLFVGQVTPSQNNLEFTTGYGSTASGRASWSAFRFGSTGAIQIYESGIPTSVIDTYSATAYNLVISLRTTGAYYFIKGGAFTNWTLVWINSANNTSTLYPGISNVSAAFTADNIRIPTSLWLPTPLAYSTFGTPGATATETTGPDSQTTPSLALTGGTVAGGALTITPTLGSELVTNGGFDTDTAWTKEANWTISGGVASHTAGNTTAVYQSVLTAGNWYSWTWTLLNRTAGSARVNNASIARSSDGTYTDTSRVSNVYAAIYSGSSDFSGSIDNVSVKPLTLSSLFSTVPTSDADVIADAKVTLTAGTQAGLVLNLDSTSSPANFIIVYHDGTSVKVDEAVAGVYTNKQTTTTTYSAGATLRAIREGTKLRVYYNNALVGAELTMTANTNTTHGLFSTYATNSFDNFTLWARGTGGEFSALDFSDPTLTRDTTTKYTGTGSAKVVTSTNDVNFVESANAGNTLTHTLSGYVYTDGSAVTSSDAELMSGSSTIATTYTSMGSGWYKLSGTLAGSASSANYGVRVKANKTVYIDDMSLTAYPASESSTSSIFDTEWNSAYGNLTFTSSVPANSTATVKVRTSNSSSMSGATDFSSCTGITSGTDISSNSCVTDGHRYVQYQVTLTSTTGTATAIVSDVSIAFTSDSTAPTSPSLDSPSDSFYTNNDRPTFKWKISTDAGSGMSKYTLTIDNGDTGDFTIDNIPTNSSLTTDKYVITYDSGGDGYISVYTKSFNSWPTSQNDGKLKEGKRTWTVTAYDTAGNTSSSSRDIYIDYTHPILTSSVSDVQATVDGYKLINTQSPEFTGTVTDNLNISKLVVSYYKENVFLGTVASEDLVDTENLTRSNTADITSWNYTFTTSDTLDYGKYRVVLTAYDTAGNLSSTTTYKLNLLTQDKINLLTDKKEKDEKTAFSIPELEKKALEKRKLEAVELTKLTDQILNSLGYIGTQISLFFDNLGSQITNFTENSRNYLASIQIPTYELPKFKMPNIKWPNMDQYAKKSQELADNFNKPFIFIQNLLDNQLKQTSKSLALYIIQTTNKTASLNTDIVKKYEEGNNKTKQKVASVWQNEKLSQALKLNIKQLQKPVVKTKSILAKIKLVIDTDIAILFDKEPTKITDVTIEEIGEDYAIVSFKTNHPAWGKVNYGESLSYGEEVFMMERSYDHTAKLTNLTKGKKYFFEVMAQNKNYAYDAYYVFETQK